MVSPIGAEMMGFHPQMACLVHAFVHGFVQSQTKVPQ